MLVVNNNHAQNHPFLLTCTAGWDERYPESFCIPQHWRTSAMSPGGPWPPSFRSGNPPVLRDSTDRCRSCRSWRRNRRMTSWGNNSKVYLGPISPGGTSYKCGRKVSMISRQQAVVEIPFSGTFQKSFPVSNMKQEIEWIFFITVLGRSGEGEGAKRFSW